jgi:hypothetical protein
MKKYLTVLLMLALFAAALPAPARADMAEYYYATPVGYTSIDLEKFIPGGYFNFSGALKIGLVLDRSRRGFAAVSLYWRGACVNIPGQFDGLFRLGRDTAGPVLVDFYLAGNLIDWQSFTATPGGKVDQIIKFDVRQPWDSVMLIFPKHPSQYVQLIGAWGARK